MDEGQILRVEQEARAGLGRRPSVETVADNRGVESERMRRVDSELMGAARERLTRLQACSSRGIRTLP